jgi:hypothetical protein
MKFRTHSIVVGASGNFETDGEFHYKSDLTDDIDVALTEYRSLMSENLLGNLEPKHRDRNRVVGLLSAFDDVRQLIAGVIRCNMFQKPETAWQIDYAPMPGEYVIMHAEADGFLIALTIAEW